MTTTTFRASAIAGAVTLSVLASALSLMPSQAEANVALDDSERIEALTELGKRVFFDPISQPRGEQSCSSCHDPSTGWTGPSSAVNEVEVAMPGAAFHHDPEARGGLRPPTNAYATLIPPFAEVENPFLPFPILVGGAFWDGRAEGDDPLYPDGATEHIYLADVLGVTEDDPDLTLFEQTVRGYLGPVADQALNPFTNPVEQNTREKGVCRHVERGDYAHLFAKAWGEPIICSNATYRTSFKRIAVALAAYQDSPEVNSFSSRRDNALRAELTCMSLDEIKALPWAGNLEQGEVESILSRFGLAPDDLGASCAEKQQGEFGRFPLAMLTEEENWGHDLFYSFGPVPAGAFNSCTKTVITADNPKPGARCVACHANNPGDDGSEPLQTYADHAYHNIGAPVNYEIPGVVESALGLAGHTGEEADIGLIKTPTLRNVAKAPDGEPDFVKAYLSNGWFKSLESLVHFYNTSDVSSSGVPRCADDIVTEAQAMGADGLPACWPAPGHTNAISIGFVTGNLGLSSCDEQAIVAYLRTFDDQRVVERPPTTSTRPERRSRTER
ncbi:cytochrome-c peroxidase [Oceanisphaera sp.]|uniref:cytochrome-c peroxidase n=1 Tax=Oceanisphaera sp. TaxID=1929979 RepID=UPI003A8D6A53